MPCSDAAKTRNPLKFAGVPQTTRWISAVSRPKFTILWDMWRTYRCLTSFFPIVHTCLSCEDIARQSCAMVPRWRFLATFLRPAFPASRVQQVSDLHLKFALRPHLCGSMVDIQSMAAEIRREKKKERRKKIEITGQKYNGLPYYIGWPWMSCELLFINYWLIDWLLDCKCSLPREVLTLKSYTKWGC